MTALTFQPHVLLSYVFVGPLRPMLLMLLVSICELAVPQAPTRQIVLTSNARPVIFWVALRTLLIDLNPLGLLNVKRIRDEGFATFWVKYGTPRALEKGNR